MALSWRSGSSLFSTVA